ncbi:MAG: primosomal protein N', partial [Bacteroidota bacterium]|nr:primosomal protein N' [Bacteroidota bacterium]
LSHSVSPGMRAIVQFGQKRIYTAIIVKIHNNPPKNYLAKEIQALPDDQAFVLPSQLKFWDWMSSYYMCLKGEIFKAALPSGLRPESETRVSLSQKIQSAHVKENFDKDSKFNQESLDKRELAILNYLEGKSSASIKEINSIVNLKNSIPHIYNLLSKNLIQIEEKLKAKYKPRFEAFINLKEKLQDSVILNATLDKLKKAPKQNQALEGFIYFANEDDGIASELRMSKLIADRQISKPALEALIKKGILQKSYKESSRLQIPASQLNSLKELSNIQGQKFEEIKKKFKTNNTILFHGVTSSGKTEIYAHLIHKEIKKGNQVLYLLPEIGLTTQIISRLKRYFGGKIGVYHSQYNDSERAEIWKNLLGKSTEKTYQIIVGVRSSIFLPFKKLGLVIIDEEHETSYKQHDPAPRYHARDAALYLAYLHQAKTLLGTATPSLESYYNVEIGKYALVELNDRHGNVKLPFSALANTRDAYRKKRMVSHFTPELYNSMSEALSKNEQIILFQNRRGWSPYIQCNECGWIPRCKHCDVNLTFHKYSNDLNCHYCGYSIGSPNVCAECESTNIRTRGFGTEKIEEETRLVFPEAKVARMDFDTTRTKRAYHKIITDFEMRKSDILIGTQMISKGLDFENVRLVGVLNADNLLFFPDFRAYERSYQLLTQVSGRAGRKSEQGKVIIQTSDPENEVLQWVIEGDYLKMYKNQMLERKAFKYPPYYKLIKITLKHKDLNSLNKGSIFLGNRLKQVFGARVLGPEFPLISKIHKWHLKSLLIKIERDRSYTKAKIILQTEINKLEKEFRQMLVVVDVDPL